MTPHDDISMKAEKLKEELWAYIDEFKPPGSKTAKAYMNSLLDAIDSFVDLPDYK